MLIREPTGPDLSGMIRTTGTLGIPATSPLLLPCSLHPTVRLAALPCLASGWFHTILGFLFQFGCIQIGPLALDTLEAYARNTDQTTEGNLTASPSTQTTVQTNTL
jgi:hypothetical protein